MNTASPNISPAVDEKLSWFTRICYGFGDTACNVVAGAMTILTFFYTVASTASPMSLWVSLLNAQILNGANPVLGSCGRAFLSACRLF